MSEPQPRPALKPSQRRPTGPSAPPPDAPSPLLAGLGRHWHAVALVSASVILFVGFLVPRWYARHYRGRVFPGVSVAGVDLGGRDAAAARAAVVEGLPVYAGRLELVDEGDPLNEADTRVWERGATDLGLALDPNLAVDLAMAAGRDAELGAFGRLFGPLQIRWRGLDLPAPIAVDGAKAEAALTELAPAYNVPPRDPRIERKGGRVLTIPAAPGRVLDVEGSLAALDAFARRPVGTQVMLAGLPTGAGVEQAGVESVAQAERLIFSGPIQMTWRDGQSYAVPTETLKAWFTVEDLPNEAGFTAPAIVVDRDAIQAWAVALAPRVSRPVVEPRFDIDPATGRFTIKADGADGIELDVDGTVEQVIRAAYAEQRTAELAVVLTAPALSDDDLATLNRDLSQVRELAVSFAGADAAQAANILAGAAQLTGAAVAPGGQFSFLAALGPVPADRGFDLRALPAAEFFPGGQGAADDWAPGGALLGGLETVSSLVFRVAFWLGLPILERRAPPVRIGWLEPPVGLDAAVGQGPSGEPRDLRFLNDSGRALVISLRVDLDRQVLVATAFGSEAAFAIRDPGYASEDAELAEDAPESDLVTEVEPDPSPPHTVRMRGPVVRDLVAALAPIGLRDERVPVGSSLRVGWAREGATVLIERYVTVGGAAPVTDVFLSSYAPSGDMTLVGTGPPAPAPSP